MAIEEPSLHPGTQALRRGRVSVPGCAYLLTTVTDQRIPWFRDFHVARAAIRALNDPATVGENELQAWVLMPDHIHLVVQLGEAERLDTFVLRIKAATSRAANRVLGRSGRLWQAGYHDHVLRRDEDLETVSLYVIMNPVRGGLAADEGGYPHWDAFWIEGSRL